MHPFAAVLCVSIAIQTAALTPDSQDGQSSEQSAAAVYGHATQSGIDQGAITTEKLEAFPLRSRCRLVDRPFLSDVHKNNHFHNAMANVPGLIDDCLAYYTVVHRSLASIKRDSPNDFRGRWGVRFDKQPLPAALNRRLAHLRPQDSYRLWRDVQTSILDAADMLRLEGHQP